MKDFRRIANPAFRALARDVRCAGFDFSGCRHKRHAGLQILRRQETVERLSGAHRNQSKSTAIIVC
jgi:hypothetical protein